MREWAASRQHEFPVFQFALRAVAKKKAAAAGGWHSFLKRSIFHALGI